MYNPDTELLFPSRVIPALRDLRGKNWGKLVDKVSNQETIQPDHLAFVLLMVRLDGCVSCNADSFRAMRGCTQCAAQNIRRFRGNDRELMKLYKEAEVDIAQANQKGDE